MFKKEQWLEQSKKEKLPEATLFERAMSHGMTKQIKDLIISLTKRLILSENKLVNWITYCGSYTSIAGSTSQDITIVGVTAAMKCMAQLTKEGATPVTIETVKCGVDKITVVFSADPLADHELDYQVFECK